MVFLVSHVSGNRQTWCINEQTPTGRELLEALRDREGNASEVVLQSQGHILGPSSPVDNESTVVATLRLCGGKGGFGSMLRAIGAQIEKTTNREACRDLSGRRLRDINEEKRLKDFIAKKADRERELQEKKQQKIKMLQEVPRHTFQDESYFKQREVREKNLYDSLDKAFAKDEGSSSTKRSLKEEPVLQVKKKRFIDDLDESSSEEEEEKNEKAAAKEKQSNGNTQPSTSREDDHEATASEAKRDYESSTTEAKKGCESSTTKRSMKEEPVARIKKGRFMDDLDESSSEEEEETSTQTSDKSTTSTVNSNMESSSKQEKETEATNTHTEEILPGQ